MKSPLLVIAALVLGLSALAPARPVSPGKVACVGDSITEGFRTTDGMTYPKQLADLLGSRWTVMNYGLGGRTLLRKGDHPYWKERALADAQNFAPQAVVLMLGTNDTKPQNWIHRSEFLSDYRDMIRVFQRFPGHPRVYVCLPCPVGGSGSFDITEANLLAEMPLIRQAARETGAELIDVHAALKPHPELIPDNVHPNNEGAAVIARTVYQALTGTAVPIPAER